MRWKIWPSSKESQIDLENRGISLLERTFKSIPAVLIGVVLTFALSRSGFFRQLETYALDTQVRLQGGAEDSDVAMVHIDDEDYATLFHEKSPLDQAILQKIISAIAAGKPRVIAVDIDTSAPEFQDIHPAQDWPKVVWAQNGNFSNIDGKYHLTQLLGQRQPPVLSGLVIMQLDADGAIRRYPRLCQTDHGNLESFPWAVAKEFDPLEVAKRPPPSTAGLFIKFAGDKEGSHRLHFTASRILELADGPGWQSESPIKDKIVLLGGAYEAKDEHDTPLGWMLGSEALAYAIETELHGGGLSPPSPILITILGGIAGVALLLLFQHFTPPKAFLISLFAIPILGMSGSLMTFKTMAFWAYFVPIPLAVLGQEIYARVRDYRMKLIKNLYEGVVKKPVVTEKLEPKSKEETITIVE
jgi:CHASE2 domain-containing sensor protein